MTRDQIEAFLGTEFESYDIGKTTPRKYLHELLATLWEEQEGFSGKRPFGNSGWSSELAHVLVRGKFIPGSVDEDGDVVDYDYKNVDKWVRAAISHIFFSR